MKDVQKRPKLGWFGVVRGHPRSSEMSPLDRAHTTSYSTLIVTMRLSCTVFEIRRVIWRNMPTLPYLTSIWRPCWGDPFKKISASENYRILGLSCGVVLRDPISSRIDTILACDRQTHRRTHDHGIYHASIASRGKNTAFSIRLTKNISQTGECFKYGNIK